MIRISLVCLAFAVGTVLSITSLTWAGTFLVWNDIFRPAGWARYYSFLHWQSFPTHIYCYALFLYAMIFTTWKKRWNPTTTHILVFCIWIWICAAFAVDWETAQAKAESATKYLAVCLVMSVALVDRRSQSIFVYGLAAAVGLWLGQAGYHALQTGGPVVEFGIPHSQMTERNDFLVAATGCLPLMIYTAWYYEGILQRWIRLGAKFLLLPATVAFFTSKSRGAFVGITALAIYFALTTGQALKRLPIILILGFIAVLAMPDYVWERMGTIDAGADQSEASAASRVDVLIASVEITADYPIFGVGPACFPKVAPGYAEFAREPHNLWTKCSSEFGIPMLAFFLYIIAHLVFGLRRVAKHARKRGDRPTEGMATAINCALVGYLFTGTFTSQFLGQYLWSIIALAGAFVASERAKENAPEMLGASEHDAAPKPEVHVGA